MLPALTALLLTLATPPTVCTIVPPMFYSDIVKTADLIVTGTALRAESRIEEGGKTIRTYVTFANLTTHKGKTEQPLVLRFEGGSVGDDRLVIADMPEFKVGSRYLLYVTGNGTNLSPIVGFHQGAFEIVDKAGREVLVSTQGYELIGVQDDRFVFAGKPEVKPLRVTVPEPVPVPGFVPKRADRDVDQKELEAARLRDSGVPAGRLVTPAPAPAVVTPAKKDAELPPVPSREVLLPENRPVSDDATPIVVPVTKDQGVRASASSLLSTVPVGGRK